MSVTGKAAAIKAAYENKTDLKNMLSYGNGIKNMVGLLQKKGTGVNIRLSITNKFDTQKTIYFLPMQTVKGSTLGSSFGDLLDKDQLPNGYPFTTPVVMYEEVEKLKITSLNRDQDLDSIANEAIFSPFQVVGISQKSYNATTGAPESGNNGNTITAYHVSSFRPKRYKDLNLEQFQSATAFANDILKVDFIKENFVCTVSTNDYLAIQVNPNTRLDITLHIGARFSPTEYFHRQVTGGQEMLMDEFGDELGSCGCDN